MPLVAVPLRVNGRVTAWLDGLESWAVTVATVPSAADCVAAVKFTTGTWAEADARRRYSAAIGVTITAFAAAGDTLYAGSSDGRVWMSFDTGRSFRLARPETGGAVERIFADPAEPRVAVAVLSGPGPRVLRTTTSGMT